MRILPFTIGSLEFVHTEGDEDFDREVRDLWHEISDAAMFKWRSLGTSQWCPPSRETIEIVFGVLEEGRLIGCWALYKVRTADREGRITAQVAPMLPEVLDGNPQDGIYPDLSRLETIGDWFLDNEMPTDERTTISLVRKRYATDAGEDDPNENHRYDNVPALPNDRTLINTRTEGDNQSRRDG